MHGGIHQDKADVHYHKNYLLKLNHDFFLCPKKGTVNLEPKFLVSEKEGTKNPLLLSTDGSGCINLGK